MAFKDVDRIQELVEELAEHGSADDPIYINDEIEPHTAKDLIHIPEYTSLHKRFMWYEAIGARCVWGTLKQMVINRGGTGKSQMVIADDPEDKCPECGRVRE